MSHIFFRFTSYIYPRRFSTLSPNLTVWMRLVRESETLRDKTFQAAGTKSERETGHEDMLTNASGHYASFGHTNLLPDGFP